MSLVNEMLRDLEDRQDHNSAQPAGVSPVLNRQRESMSMGSKWSLSIGLVLIVVALAVWGWNNQWWQAVEGQPTLSANPNMESPATVVTETSAVAQAPVKPMITTKPVAEPVVEQAAKPETQTVASIPVEKVKPVKEAEPVAAVAPKVAITEAVAAKTMVTPENIEPIATTTSALTADPEPPTPQQPLTEVAEAAQTITTSATTLDQQAVATARELVDEGQIDRARNLLEEHLRQYPQASQSARELTLLSARTLLAQGQLEKAKSLLELAPPTIDHHPDYHALLAGIYHKSGQHRAAAELYNQLVKVERSNSIYWLGLAVALDALKDRNALNAFRTTRSLNSNPDIQHYIEQRIAALGSKENRP